MFHRIVASDVVVPQTFSRDATQVIRGLLSRNVQQRLGCGAEGANEIMSSPFFSVIDFEALFRKEIVPPFKPDVSGTQDTKYVPRVFLDSKAVDSMDVTNTTAKHKSVQNPQFESFTYAGESNLDG